MNVDKNYVQLKEVENISDARKKRILAEREAYLRGENKSFSWEQIKEMALNKDRRNAL